MKNSKYENLRIFLLAQKGVVAIETALLFPLVLMVTFFLFELGLVMWGMGAFNNILAQASRAGQVGCVAGSGTTGCDIVDMEHMKELISIRTAGFVKPEKIKMSVQVVTTSDMVSKPYEIGKCNLGGPKDLVRYHVEYDWPLYFPGTAFWKRYAEHLITFNATNVVRNENFSTSLDPDNPDCQKNPPGPSCIRPAGDC